MFVLDPPPPPPVSELEEQAGPGLMPWCGSGTSHVRRSAQSLFNASETKTCQGCGDARLVSDTRPPNDADPQHPGLTVLTADTFDELVVNRVGHVFVMVSADWCGACQAAKPAFYRLALMLQVG